MKKDRPGLAEGIWAHIKSNTEAITIAASTLVLFIIVGLQLGLETGARVAVAFYILLTAIVNGLLIYPLLHALLSARPTTLIRRAGSMSWQLWVYLLLSTSLATYLALEALPQTTVAIIVGAATPILLVLYALDLLGYFPLRGD
jgi:hypothetical protein